MLKLLRRLFWVENQLKMEGQHTERFVNLCAKNNIRLEEIRRTEQCTYASAFGFCENKLKELSEKAEIHITVIKKRGLLYQLMHYRCRIVFYLMPLIVFLILFLLSRYIWSVEVNGNQSISRDMLCNYLTEQGWYYGGRISSMDPEKMEEQLREHFPVITWVNVVIDGTCLIIDIKENAYLTEWQEISGSEHASDYGNMVASEDGVVTSIITRTGTPQCKAGDSVSQGQILVTGEIPIYNTTGDTVIDYRYVEADADIILQYKISYLDFAAFESSVKEYTGAYKESYFLAGGGKEWNIGIKEAPFDTYDCFSLCYQLRCMDNFYLPCYYGKIEYCETCFHNVYRNETQIREILSANYENYLEELSTIGIEVVDDEIQYIPGTQGIYLSGHLTVCAPGGSYVPMEKPVRLPLEDIINE